VEARQGSQYCICHFPGKADIDFSEAGTFTDEDELNVSFVVATLREILGCTWKLLAKQGDRSTLEVPTVLP